MEKVATDIYSDRRLCKEGLTYVGNADTLFAMALGEMAVQFFATRSVFKYVNEYAIV